jgi:carboxymethylenebutenolidase
VREAALDIFEVLGQPRAAVPSCSRIEACGSRSEIEVYPGVDHGFAFPRCATYHHAAERHWARLLDLFNRALTPH